MNIPFERVETHNIILKSVKDEESPFVSQPIQNQPRGAILGVDVKAKSLGA
ncbi:hypothetical protein GCM10007868_27630 [Gluconobacter frateurii]|uniref:Transposase n=1 Tax=Gluconobacter frateurii NRIC 0228 TaxID=1307946 RepID=A0ABQ0Q9Q3_9PROT|nr:hypothetical protein AA0228_0945 [Gluconobacter frateurii NRIC 0228]GLP91688.1 hypothetical protein GCM10007868_27630 [Gluconobacter frateurii]